MAFLFALAAICFECLVRAVPDVDPNYENNFYIILSSSKFFFNYRHSGDTLIFYRYLRERGITDDKIIMMLPENHACNARNKFPGQVFGTKDHRNMYCDDIEVDYKYDDLTYYAILNLIRGRYPPNVSILFIQSHFYKVPRK
jgi:phosphatidylinositol glycan class K